ncbi:MAG: 16S rRNA (guanine(966)-N(2))-methyltransferase RsmD [Acidobacteriota bacterium]
MSRSRRSGSLRVIAGSAGGRRLRSLPGLEVRPTLDRVKQAVFSSLGVELKGARFLDLFAGTGAVGIEALSRGARSVVFVDNSRRCCDVLRQNLEDCGLEGRARVIQSDWESALVELRHPGEPFDIAYVDPPYSRTGEAQILEAAAGLTTPNGCLLFEHLLRNAPPERVGDRVRGRTAPYGQTAITWYLRANGVVDTPRGCP